MGVKKQKSEYFIYYGNGTKIKVSEELYRIWAYYTNKEFHCSRQYSPRLVSTNKGPQVLPSRLISFEDYISSSQQMELNPVKIFNHRIVTELLLRCIRALPEKQSKTILLLYFDGRSESEAARILNVCQSSVSNYKRRALVTLKKLILFEGYSSDDLFSMLQDG